MDTLGTHLYVSPKKGSQTYSEEPTNLPKKVTRRRPTYFHLPGLLQGFKSSLAKKLLRRPLGCWVLRPGSVVKESMVRRCSKAALKEDLSRANERKRNEQLKRRDGALASPASAYFLLDLHSDAQVESVSGKQGHGLGSFKRPEEVLLKG